MAGKQAPLCPSLQVDLLGGPVSCLACLESELRGQTLTSYPAWLAGLVMADSLTQEEMSGALTSSPDCSWRCQVP